jgi:sugar O-acyltransferase (sialic acid O-acetyltransferase NeuD family)
VRDLGIFGTSGHAREIGDVACDLGYRPIYITHLGRAAIEAWSFPEEIVEESGITGRDMAFAIGIGDNALRQQVATRFAGLPFVTLIHPTATFGQRQRERVEAARGVVVCAGVRLTNNIRVGQFVVFNRDANVGHDGVVGDFAHLAPRACVSGNVRIGARCWIGAGAVVNQGTNERPLAIGDDTVVGSGAVVIGDCEPNAVYAGVPARRIR